MPKLLLKFNAVLVKEVPLDKPAISVGRKPDNDIVIDNPAVSGHHCRISASGESYYIEDLESTNGTFVNEKRVMKAELKHNDVIGLARHTIVFVGDAPPDAEATLPLPESQGAAAEPPKKETPAPPSVELSEAQPGKQTESPPQAEPAVQAEPAQQDAAAAPKTETKAGWVRVLKNGVGPITEFELKGLSTYIGKADRAQIRIKGGGLFGSAPDVAASIHRKPDGYVLVAVKAGFPVVNGKAVTGQVALTDGSIIECGATTLQFFLK